MERSKRFAHYRPFRLFVFAALVAVGLVGSSSGQRTKTSKPAAKAAVVKPAKLITWAEFTKAIEGPSGVDPRDKNWSQPFWTSLGNKPVFWEGVLQDPIRMVGDGIAFAAVTLVPSEILVKGTDNKKLASYLSLKLKASDIPKWQALTKGSTVKFKAVLGILKASEADRDDVVTFFGSLIPGKEFGSLIALAREGELVP